MDSQQRTLWLVVVSAAVAVAAMVVGAFNVAWTSAALSALAGTLAARGAAGAHERARWSWWAAAAAAWLLGQVAWDAFAVVGSPASPNLADAGWWAFAVLVVAGLVQRGSSRTLRLVAVVEALPLIAAAMALTSAELWDEAARSSLPVAGRVSALMYPGLYVSAAVLTLQAMLAGSLRGRRGAGLRLVLGGIVAQAVAFIAWSEQLLDGRYATGQTLVDPLWVLGMLAIGTGGMLVARNPHGPAPPEEPGDLGGVLPAATFVLLVVDLFRASFTAPPPGARIALLAGLAICGATLIARSVLLGRRQRTLLAREREGRMALAEREAELQRLNERLAEDSRRDTLTGLRNRRALAEDLAAVEAEAARRGTPYAVVLCDVDHFKPYNDRLGHLAGDEALRALAVTIRGELRAGDAAYRYGGEELLLVLRDASAEDALRAAERVRAAVSALALPHPDGVGGIITVSAGVAGGAGGAEALLARAEPALYAAKGAGRNRVSAEGGAAAAAPRASALEQPLLRQLQSVLAISRAASERQGLLPVLEAVAQTIRSELRFATVVVNLRADDVMEAVVVLGDEEAREALLGTSGPMSSWMAMMGAEYERRGAYWLPAGSYAWDESIPVWTPTAHGAPVEDAWHPEDALLLPLRDSTGEVLGVVAVDEPLSGRRPRDEELDVLMAVADHAALVIEQLRRERAAVEAASRQPEAHRLAAVMLLAETLDLRDVGTADHSRTVGVFARDTACALGLPAGRVDRIHAAGVLHDLGKLAAPDAILHKPGALDDAEWREMRRHPEVGAQILDHAGLHESPRGCERTTSASTAVATRTASPATRSRSRPASSRSPTPTRR